jgi:hypothetical protein
MSNTVLSSFVRLRVASEFHRCLLYAIMLIGASLRLLPISLRRPTPSNVDRNAILKILLARPELSIYALNAAMDCAQGATPLALASSLGHVDQVNTLLSCPSVVVDTRDASGLTPLMRTSPFLATPHALPYKALCLRARQKLTLTPLLNTPFATLRRCAWKTHTNRTCSGKFFAASTVLLPQPFGAGGIHWEAVIHRLIFSRS